MLGTQPESMNKVETSFPVVCIGMSAGAVPVLVQLFRAISPNTGMAFIVIHHLHHHRTLLPQILSKSSAMPVQLALPGLMFQPNHIYILSSGQEMVVADGYFLVQPRSKLRGWTNVITIFLDSLSRSRHPGIAVILSGMDEDGAAALSAFDQKGGITIVQAPHSATHPQMPWAAIHTGHVDRILAPEAIATELGKIAEAHKHRLN